MRSSAPTTICRTSSRTSARSFTNKPQRKPARSRAVHNLDLKPAGDPGLNKAAKVVPQIAGATWSTPSSKLWTKTRKNNGNNLLTTAARSTVAGSTQKQKEKNKRLWQQLT